MPNQNFVMRLLSKPVSWRAAITVGPCLALIVGFLIVPDDANPLTKWMRDRNRWVDSSYFKSENGREFLLASIPLNGPTEWFDITDMPLDKKRFQYGIGKDKIPSIDDPVFVTPDDDRLLALARETITKTDELQVIGFAENGVAKAYPIGLLDEHELVNDIFTGRPVTVGW